MFETGEFRKFWLAIFGLLCCVAIIVIALVAPVDKEMAFAAFTLAGNLAVLVFQYYFRRKTPNDNEVELLKWQVAVLKKKGGSDIAGE